ncbi:hypothetical protein [Brevibacillus laterosporus]
MKKKLILAITVLAIAVLPTTIYASKSEKPQKQPIVAFTDSEW